VASTLLAPRSTSPGERLSAVAIRADRRAAPAGLALVASEDLRKRGSSAQQLIRPHRGRSATPVEGGDSGSRFAVEQPPLMTPVRPHQPDRVTAQERDLMAVRRVDGVACVARKVCLIRRRWSSQRLNAASASTRPAGVRLYSRRAGRPTELGSILSQTERSHPRCCRRCRMG
jgi:hypothetical protein